MLRRAAVAGLLLAWTAAPARAQIPTLPRFEAGQTSIGLLLGPSWPTGTNGFASVAGRGYGAGLQLLYYPWDWIAFGPAFGMTQFGKQDIRADSGRITGLGKATVSHLSLLTRLNMVRGESWTPYLLGGVGYHLFSHTADAQGSAGAVVCADTSAPATCAAQKSFTTTAEGLLVTGAAGAEFFYGTGLSLSLETRYQRFQVPRIPAASIPLPSGAAESVTVNLAAHLWLGL
ncbi:MAG: hypothetical protein A2X36_00860 [Elusimicrobia bacterium GWA2_69_24]|nr:MAG: hypothetical protein A2X36_00860 [Elusimicrobia bacterium GWA2_69_24]HBL16527.1 hypothetical protein [Elusimicrobiota bacterium]